MSFGHGISHLYDLSLPAVLPTIASFLGLSNFQVAGLHGVRQAGSGVVNLGGGPVVDVFKRQWGLILTGCMVWAAISYALLGSAPNYPLLVTAILFVSIPGSLWHMPAAAALSQRFPDRRGFAISMHGFGSNIGNALGPQIAKALLTVLFWRNLLRIYAAPALLMAVFVWWALRDVGKDAGQAEQDEEKKEGSRLAEQLRKVLPLYRNPLVLGLVLAALMRGIGLTALFNWTPFYLEEELGMGHIRTGFYLSLLTGMGIVSAPVLGHLSDRVDRKRVLVPGFAVAAALSLVVVSVGDSPLLALVMAGMGLFSFALHNIIQASVLDVVGRGNEALGTGLLFGLNGVLGSGSPFLAALIIDHLGGYGFIYYYAGALTALTAVIVLVIPMGARAGESAPAPG